MSIYNQAGQLLTVLDNAGDIGYDLKHNDLWTGSFTLPARDEKNASCAAHNLVRLPDGPRKTGLFRIVSMPSSEETAMGGLKTYNVEHVMATLLDDVLFGYHEIGGDGVSTRDVMQYILDRQTVTRWQLGTVDFTDYFQYHFENVSLLSALLSLGEVLTDEYTWDFDTDTTPWTVNLRRADAATGCGIYYGRNLVQIEKSMDASALVTRLYPLGYGEGVNQLTIRDVNNGLPYIDADTVGTWGVKCSVWTDTRIEDPATLLARARQVLEGYKNPYITYTAKAVDLYQLTGFSWDNFMPGKLVTVQDAEHGITFQARIVEIQKSNVNGNPGDIEITIANAPRDAADSINTLADRVGIGELYSQGATNLFAQTFADNADATHPAKMRVYVPSGLVRINKMLLSWQVAPFRAYETGAAAGGSTEQTSGGGGSSSQTTSTNDTVTYTSETGGGCTVTTETKTFTPGGESGNTTVPVGGSYTDYAGEDNYTTEAGEHSHTVNSHNHAMGHIHSISAHKHTVDSHNHDLGSHSHTVDSHSHSLNSHSHSFSDTYTLAWGHTHGVTAGASYTSGVTNYEAKTISISGDTGNASGSTGTKSPGTSAATGNTGTAAPDTSEVSLTTGGASASGSPRANTGDASPGTDSQGKHKHIYNTYHRHEFGHYHKLVSITIPPLTVEVPDHGHNVRIPGHSHSVSIPSHTHTVTIPDHTHDIVYGIYEGTTARSVTILVDGNTVPASAISQREIDVSAWLDKDENGKITRNSWHEIQIVPDQLTRIEANLFAQCFIQSVGGGDY